MLAEAGDLAGLDKPQAASHSGVWIYGDALPQRLVSEDEADILLRGISLGQSKRLSRISFINA